MKNYYYCAIIIRKASKSKATFIENENKIPFKKEEWRTKLEKIKGGFAFSKQVSLFYFHPSQPFIFIFISFIYHFSLFANFRFLQHLFIINSFVFHLMRQKNILEIIDFSFFFCLIICLVSFICFLFFSSVVVLFSNRLLLHLFLLLFVLFIVF